MRRVYIPCIGRQAYVKPLAEALHASGGSGRGREDGFHSGDCARGYWVRLNGPGTGVNSSAPYTPIVEIMPNSVSISCSLDGLINPRVDRDGTASISERKS
jgi:hypothetical protein